MYGFAAESGERGVAAVLPASRSTYFAQWLLDYLAATSRGRCCPRQVLDLAIRSGKRELIHKGPLRVLSLAKEGGVRLAYFYVFNDVVSVFTRRAAAACKRLSLEERDIVMSANIHLVAKRFRRRRHCSRHSSPRR